MHLIPPTPTSYGPAERFTGQVYVESLASMESTTATASCRLVWFAPRAHSAWHCHTLSQALRVTDGLALVQARREPAALVRPGQTIYTPAGQGHWHGATAQNCMSHLNPSQAPDDGSAVQWGEHVSDQEYLPALHHHDI